jgi:protein-S-isoprenylcysteine O-methyltransferase Ste14
VVALRTLVFSIFVPGMVAIGLPQLYLRTQTPTALPSPVSATGIAGSLLGVLGVALYCWCASEFTFRGKGTPAPTDPPKFLMKKGPYRWTRNPMYVAVLSTILGEALLFLSLPLVILCRARLWPFSAGCHHL